MKEELLNIIKAHGPDEPIASFKIEERLGIPGSEVRAFVKALRHEGEPICICSNGYYYANEFSHVEKTVRNLESRATSLFKTASLMRKRFSEVNFEPNGQGKLF